MDERVVMGPLFTRGGFQAWFFVCFEDAIVCVPQGFWYAVAATATGGAAMHFGLVGGLVHGLAQSSDKKREDKRVAQLRETPRAALAAAPGNVVYPVREIAAIEAKRVKIGSPEVIVETKDGRRQVYGIVKLGQFDDVLRVLTAVYPTLAVEIP